MGTVKLADGPDPPMFLRSGSNRAYCLFSISCVSVAERIQDPLRKENGAVTDFSRIYLVTANFPGKVSATCFF